MDAYVNGADGGIGATYNVMPGWFVSLYRAFRAGHLSEAMSWQQKINRVIHLLQRWYPSNIVSIVKETLRLQGYDAGSAVYPARDLPADRVQVFRNELAEAGIELRH